MLNWQDKILKWQNGRNYDYLCPISENIVYRKVDFYPAKTLKFEGKTYNVPNNYKKILTKIYGDYMKLPPKKERKTHCPVRLEFTVDCNNNKTKSN